MAAPPTEPLQADLLDPQLDARLTDEPVPFDEAPSEEPSPAEGRPLDVIREEDAVESGGVPPSGSRKNRDADIGRVLGGKYRCETLIAVGGMSRVYLGRQEPLGREVAIKLLRPDQTHDGSGEPADDARLRFRREAETLCAIDHPNIVSVFDFDIDDDQVGYLVMEYIRGIPLSKWIRKNGPVEPVLAVSIAKQLAEALSHIHSIEVVHRDLKPSNVMLRDASGSSSAAGASVKIIDFGIVKRFSAPTAEATDTRLRVGSPGYMAPEQILGKTVSAATDVYALGCVLYCMLMGKAPFRDKEAIQVMYAHVTQSAPPLSGSMSPELIGVVNKAMAKKVAERYASMEELLTALFDTPEYDQLMDISDRRVRSLVPPVEPPPPPALEEHGPWWRKRPEGQLRVALIAAAVAAGALTAGLWGAGTGGDSAVDASQIPEMGAEAPKNQLPSGPSPNAPAVGAPEGAGEVEATRDERAEPDSGGADHDSDTDEDRAEPSADRPTPTRWRRAQWRRRRAAASAADDAPEPEGDAEPASADEVAAPSNARDAPSPGAQPVPPADPSEESVSTEPLESGATPPTSAPRGRSREPSSGAGFGSSDWRDPFRDQRRRP